MSEKHLNAPMEEFELPAAQPLPLPTENEITARPTPMGRLVAWYKRVIKRLIDPYLRNVFDREHEHLRLINQRLGLCDQRMDRAETYLIQLRHHQLMLENEKQREMIQRIDSAVRILHLRLEKIEQALEIKTSNQDGGS